MFVVALTLASVGVLVVGFCASACFFASRTLRLCSASLLPAVTRPGCFAVAGFVFWNIGSNTLRCCWRDIFLRDRLEWFCLHHVYIASKKKTQDLSQDLSQQLPQDLSQDLHKNYLKIFHNNYLKQLHQTHVLDNLRCLVWGV